MTPNDVFILAFVTAGHVEECANMLWWLRQSEPDVPVRLFALDSKARDAFLPSPLLDVQHRAVAKRANVNYGTRDFSALLTARVQVIASEIKAATRPVLLMDTDIIVLKPFLREMLSDYPASKVDFVNQRGMSQTGPHNGGFILFHPTWRSVAFTAEYARYRKALRTPAHDQGVLNSLIKERHAGVRVDLLPNSTFPVGGVYFGNQESFPPRGSVPPRRREELPREARLFHNNCIIGLQSKIERLKHYGLWNLSQARAASIIRLGFTQKLDNGLARVPHRRNAEGWDRRLDRAEAFFWGSVAFFSVLAVALGAAVCARVVCGVTIERAKE